MGIFQVVLTGLLANLASTQEAQDCNEGITLLTVSGTADAIALAKSLECSDGEFSVQWVGEVIVAETIRVSNGTSLNITGAGAGAIADGQGSTQLFHVDEVSRLHLSDITLTNGSASEGGAIYVRHSEASFSGNTLFSSNQADGNGGAVYASSSDVSWEGDGIQFSSNHADGNGGAVYASSSHVSWESDDIQFSSNSATNGGAIAASFSNVSWDGDDLRFSANAASSWGGAIYAMWSEVSWDGDGIQFSSNSGYEGGAIYAGFSNMSWYGKVAQFNSNPAIGYGGAVYAFISHVLWHGDGARFNSNSAGTWGGAIYATYSNVAWDGDDTLFSSNFAAGGKGGAIYLFESTVSWIGAGTEFNSNNATGDGGAIYSTDSSKVYWDGDTTFGGNSAAGNGGALALNGFGDEEGEEVPFANATFINNSAGLGAGAWYMINLANPVTVSGMTFEANSAQAGGAIAAYVVGTDVDPATFSQCNFLDNEASGSGGAVEILSGYQEFSSCYFKGNSAYVGGALRLGGTTTVSGCSFLSNSATDRGLAIAVVATLGIDSSSFDNNELYCQAGTFRNDTEEGTPTARFGTVCLDCPSWDECSNCSITNPQVTQACVAPLDHTSARESALTLETLEIDAGYWRATNASANILACYKSDACKGGETGADDFCAPGYTGPYCSVCETDYAPLLAHTCTKCSSSKRQGLVAATVIAAVVAVFAVVTTIKYLLSTEREDASTGCFHRGVLRAVPVQALKIVVVVWQIVTQFADAANATYPGVYQDFLSTIDIVNFELGSVVAAACLWPDIDFHGRLLASTILPLVVVGCLAITYPIAVRDIPASGDPALVAKIRHKHQAALLFVTFFVYSSVSSMVFQTFACETLDDGIEYLRADYRIRCTDARHKAFEVYAGIMVLVYPVGIPLLYAILLFQRREVLADAAADKTTALSIAGLWEPYTPERFYYEVVECGRRIMLTGVVVFIFPNDAAQVAITMLNSFFFFAVFEVLSPYKSDSDMWLSRGGHVIVFLSMFDLLLSKVDVSDERDQSRTIFAGVLVAGHVLMVVAIVVEVLGIIYSTGREKKRVDEDASESFPRTGENADSDDVPVFETIPSSWKSFVRQVSVSQEPKPIRRISETDVWVDRS